MFKRLFSFLMAAVLLVSFPNYTKAANVAFKDVNGHWAYASIMELVEKGIVAGMGDGTYGVDGKVTREQFMKLLVATFETPAGSRSDVFNDVPAGSWSNPYIYAGLDRGILKLEELNGSSFRPADPMSREVVALWITRALDITGEAALNFKDAESIVNKQAVANAAMAGLLSGYEDGTYRPNNTLTRAEAAIIIKRVMDRKGAGTGADNAQQSVEPYNPKDFDPAYLRTSKNTFILQDNVKKIESPPKTNMLAVEDDEKGYYIFENISEEISSLKVGELLAIYPCENVPRGMYLKVKDINVSNGKAELWRDDMKFEEIIKEIDIAKIVEISLDGIDPNSLPEGVRLVPSNNSRPQATGLMYSNTNNKIRTLQMNKNLVPLASEAAFEIETKKTFEINVEMGSGKLYCELTLANPKLLVDIETSKVFGIPVGLEKADVKLENSVGVEVGCEIKGELPKIIEFPLCKVSALIPGTPLIADVQLIFSATPEGKINISASIDAKSTIGLNYINGKTTPVSNLTLERTFKAEAEGKLSIGPKFEAGVSLPFVINISVNAGMGLAVTASISIERSEGIDIDSGEIKSFTNESKSEMNSVDGITSLHIDYLCIDGKIYRYLSTGLVIKLGFGKVSVTPVSLENKTETNLGDFYISQETQESKLEFGLGKCPHIYKKPKIKTQPVSIDADEGQQAKFTIVAEIAGDGQVMDYQWQKDGVDIQGETSATLSIANVKKEDAGSYSCVVYNLKARDLLSVKSNAVQLKVKEAEEYEIPPIFLPILEPKSIYTKLLLEGVSAC